MLFAPLLFFFSKDFVTVVQVTFDKLVSAADNRLLWSKQDSNRGMRSMKELQTASAVRVTV